MPVKQDVIGLLNFRPVRLVALTILVVGVGTACLVTKLSVLDLDIWWHLAAGNWILQHHVVPHTGILSRTAADHPWMAYSWGYEVLLSRSYAWFGFLGIAWFGTALTIAVAVALFWMIRRLSGRFWLAWILSIVASFAFLFNIMPRPVFLSMMFFAVTITLLMRSNRTGRTRGLYWLPLIFFVWANLHVQYVYGLFAVGLFVGIHLLQRIFDAWRILPAFFAGTKLPVPRILVVFACCIAATCLGPYTFHVYDAVFGYANSKVIYTMIAEAQALSFAGPSHFVELFLGAAAFFALGWRRKIDVFQLALLVVASIFAFRMTRDAWFLCITAAAIIADSAAQAETEEPPFRMPELAGVGFAAALLLLLIARNTDFNQRGLDRAISGQFPVDAVNYLRRNPVRGPLYNSFDWGGFLTFYLPEYPVAIDGRTDLYGDALDEQFYTVEGGDSSYANDPYLNEAGLIILRNKVPLAQLLPTDRRFRVIYRDALATILVRN